MDLLDPDYRQIAPVNDLDQDPAGSSCKHILEEDPKAKLEV